MNILVIVEASNPVMQGVQAQMQAVAGSDHILGLTIGILAIVGLHSQQCFYYL